MATSVQLSASVPDDLVALVGGRPALDGITRGESVRRVLIEYLTE